MGLTWPDVSPGFGNLRSTSGDIAGCGQCSRYCLKSILNGYVPSVWMAFGCFMTVGSEKITINLGPVDLGRIDLLVQEGFYANRSDFIRTAIRNQLVAEREPLARSIERHSLDLGVREITRHELEKRGSRKQNPARQRGWPRPHRIGSDVTPDLARAAISSVSVLGSLQASAEVKAALADRL